MESLPEIEGYEIIKKLGSGTFGIVYKAIDKSNNNEVAIKVEKKSKISRLKNEKDIYDLLKDHAGFPNIYKFIKTDENTIVIMDYLGPSLEDLYQFCNNNFSLKTVLMIAIQILNRIEILHKAGFLHRDIKPDNFLIGVRGKKSKVYMIDLGLSKKYILDNKHISYKTGKSFTGSFRYSSIRNHKGIEQSRRDDLESIGYMLIYFLKKTLPWQGLKGSTKSKRSTNIFNMKKKTSLEDLCSDLPKEFMLYMKYCRLLRFLQIPDYNLLRNLFISVFKKHNYELNFIYDWNIVAKEKKI